MKYAGRWWLLVIPALLLTLRCEARGQCGVERWTVKTGTDSAASSIDLTSTSPTTISTLVALSAPHPIPPTSRVSPTETTVWTLNATLVEFKLESDSDYHLVLSDDAGNTMIAEIPSPSCVNGSSPFAAAITQARSQFDAAFTVTSSFQQANVPVQVIGIGMFDFLHGQTGVAPNGIELHPILKIAFGTLSLSASPTAVALQAGASASVTVAASAAGAVNGPVSLAVSGIPSGVTATFTPTSIGVPGTSTLTLSAAPDASTGSNLPITITGADGGGTSSTTVILSVASAATADFSLSASPSALVAIPGTPVTTTVSTTTSNNFAADIALSTPGLPQGMTASFNPATIASPGSGSSVVTIGANSTVPAGNVNIQIAGGGGGLTHATGVSVNVCAAPQPAPAMTRLRSALRTTASAELRDDDDGRIRIVPSSEAFAEARQHAADPICTPRQSDVFLGSGWAEPANRTREGTLAHTSAGLRASAICLAGAAPSAPIVHEAFEHVDGNLSDLEIQTRLQAMLGTHQLEPPTLRSIYVVFLAPEIRSQIGKREAGLHYLAYHNHFHAREGVVHYVVVPFDSDSKRQRRSATRAILNALMDPDGPVD